MKKKFKIPLRDGSTKEVRFADAFQMYGLRFVVHRSAGINLRQDTDSLGNGWEVSEYSTGCAATEWINETIPEAIGSARRRLAKAGEEKTTSAIASCEKINQ